MLQKLEKYGIKGSVKFLDEDEIVSLSEMREFKEVINDGKEDAVKKAVKNILGVNKGGRFSK